MARYRIIGLSDGRVVDTDLTEPLVADFLHGIRRAIDAGLPGETFHVELLSDDATPSVLETRVWRPSQGFEIFGRDLELVGP
jgi:hypothetical protein